VLARLLTALTALSLSSSAIGLEAKPNLVALFQQLQSDVAHRESLEELRGYFTPAMLDAVGPNFRYEWLDVFVGTGRPGGELLQRVQGNEGCVAYAIPYRAQAPGPWVELRTLTYSLIGANWKVSDVHYSISAHHNVVHGSSFCFTLGWPWQ